MSETVKNHPALLQVFAQRVKLEKRDSSYWAVCPFHPDKNPSFNLNRDEKGDWVAHCFGCGWGGDVLAFLQKFDKISFGEAVKIVEGITGGDWEETKNLADRTFQKIDLAEIKPAKRYSLHEYAKFEIALYESEVAKEWLFRERGILYDTARKLHFGFCQNLESINKKFSEDLRGVADSGWIITPAVEGDEVVCIELRSMAEKKFSRKTGMETKVLFGVDWISPDEVIYITEGKFDQAVMIQAGYRAVSLPNASMNLTPEMRDRIMGAAVVILAGDNDGSVGTDRMNKLWAEFKERTYRLVWPKGQKDANQTYLEVANRDISVFRNLVDNLVVQAYANPLPGVKSLQDILRSDESGTAEDNPNRFRFCWNSVDSMANILPGSIVYVSATQTSSGKTQFLLQSTIAAARKNDEVVLNYQTEMSDSEIGEIVTANLMAKERGDIKKEDRLEAAKKLKGVSYFIGNNPNLNTMTEVLDLIEAGVRRVGATSVVLDHIHFICRNEKDETKAQSQAMQRIKRMAQIYRLKFFVVGQPRKPGQKTQGKQIDIYDAKGSESLVSDADVVLYLHREVVKNMDENTKDNLSPEVQIRCMKGRSRGKGAAFTKLFFIGAIATFTEIINIEPPMTQSDFEF
jgi:hypothetical protein